MEFCIKAVVSWFQLLNQRILYLVKIKTNTWSNICAAYLSFHRQPMFIYSQLTNKKLLLKLVFLQLHPLSPHNPGSSNNSCTMLLLLHICRHCCPTFCADAVFTCLVKWWSVKAVESSKYDGMLASICG